MSAIVRIGTSNGQTTEILAGGRLVFGRGPDVDLTFPSDPVLSRRAGVITVLAAGAWIGNLSHTHALYVESDGSRVRLPPLPQGQDRPQSGWFLREGTVLVGSRSMLEDGGPLHVGVESAVPTDPFDVPTGDATLLPLTLEPRTKLFLVALLWCRPWLTDPSRQTPLPRAPEIARAALEVTSATFELDRFDHDPAFRERLSAQVAEHLKVLRRKIVERGLVRVGLRLSDEVVVRVLVEFSIITPGDLDRLADPGWRSRQEDLWWQRGVRED